MRNILKPHSGTHSGTVILDLKNYNFEDFRWRGQKIDYFLYAKKYIKSTRNIVQLFI